MTTVLSTVAVLAVGSYLSSVIADGLYEQRRERVLEETAEVRSDLMVQMANLADSTSTQQQDQATAFVNPSVSQGEASHREIALVPVDEGASVLQVASDESLLDQVGSGFRETVAAEAESLVWRSIAWDSGSGQEIPALLVGTRVEVPGTGTYDLFVLYPMEEEQETLSFVQRVMLGGGGVLLALVVGIAVVVARLVTTPLKRAAEAAERMAGGDLSSRVVVSGGDELARVGVSFNEMADTLEQKVEDLTELSRLQHRFVSDVSHELRTPLTTIRMAASVLNTAREDLPGELGRTAELLTAQVERFDALLADLLEISRFDAGAAVLEPQREDLGALVERAVRDAAPLAEARGCELEVHPAAGDLHAVVDARRVDRVLRNLLTNAIEHGAGGPVVVRCAGDEQAVAVVVQDFGHGISPQDARRVFDRFWRADPSRARTLGGTGLGLSISAEDTRLHEGWLQAWGQEGRGAVFRLTLPRRPGTPLTRSPLRLERSFVRGAEEPPPITGELSVAPDQLPGWDAEESPADPDREEDR